MTRSESAQVAKRTVQGNGGHHPRHRFAELPGFSTIQAIRSREYRRAARLPTGEECTSDGGEESAEERS